MLSLLLAFPLASAQPMPVHLTLSKEGKPLLLRNNKPFLIRGAGGNGSLELLAKAGGNAIRTWGVGPETTKILDDAHQLNIAVAVGIWLGHQRHGFDYADPIQVQKQQDMARQTVLKYKDHPAVLIWGVGNEMEGFEKGNDPNVWNAVCEIATMIKELDPNHPIMTTTADIGGGRIAGVNSCDAIDIHGINSYGGAPSLPTRYPDNGGRKPVILTEFGPPGTWEVGRNDFGATLELSSTEKSNHYRDVWKNVIQTDPLFLGGFAFTWGAKVEATTTWFGMFLPDGPRLASVDTMAELWGRPFANKVPVIEQGLQIEGSNRVAPNATITATWKVTDPEQETLQTTWTLRREALTYITGGDAQAIPMDFPNAIKNKSTQKAQINMPAGHGIYRLYATVRDSNNGGATASIPILVGSVPKKADPLPMPWNLYTGEGESGGPFLPTGRMGDVEDLSVDFDHNHNCHGPPTCIRTRFTNEGRWAGVVWQYPADNWGKNPGLNMANTEKVTFWVRSDFTGVKAKFGFGMEKIDTTSITKTISIPTKWTKITLPIKGDKTSIISGFWFVLGNAQQSTYLYLDDIVFE